MGLFKKKATDPSEIDRLKREIASMAARLDAADTAKQQLGDQMQGIVTRLDTPPPPPAAAAMVSPAEFATVRSNLETVVERLDAAPEPSATDEPTTPTIDPDEFEDVRTKVQTIVERLENKFEPPPDPEPPAPIVDPDEFEAVSSKVHTIAERMNEIDAVSAQVETIAVRIDQLDARITSISNELANQITELSGDIEALGDDSDAEPASELVDQLRDTQVKLANEQARYQIAFRQDLANLADFLKHT